MSDSINIVQLKMVKKIAPKDLADDLRELARGVDAGEVTALVAGYVDQGAYCFLHGASIVEGQTLAALLEDRCIDRFKV